MPKLGVRIGMPGCGAELGQPLMPPMGRGGRTGIVGLVGCAGLAP
jgi:hypothetical protein